MFRCSRPRDGKPHHSAICRVINRIWTAVAGAAVQPDALTTPGAGGRVLSVSLPSMLQRNGLPMFYRTIASFGLLLLACAFAPVPAHAQAVLFEGARVIPGDG